MQLLYRLITDRFSASHKIYFVIILLTTAIEINTASGQRSCYRCEGINCLRTTYNQVEKCANALDICATIFDGQTIQAQGCLESLEKDLRIKCDSNVAEECHTCNENLCNKMAASSFECIQCDSKTDSNCYNNAHLLEPKRCPISRTPNQYCYAKKDGDWIVRGCTSTLVEQRSCLDSQECIICQPSDMNSCNIQRATDDEQPISSVTPPTTTSTTPTPPEGNGCGSISSFVAINYIVVLFASILKFY